jgi:hypothetical protein
MRASLSAVALARAEPAKAEGPHPQWHQLFSVFTGHDTRF